MANDFQLLVVAAGSFGSSAVIYACGDAEQNAKTVKIWGVKELGESRGG